MLATLVIGLREGLEASLIVGIIAAFLVRNGKSLRPMWIGVGSAVALSVLVGVVLEVISAQLPQAKQEGMESIIGLVAVAVVTGMVGWMHKHARNMRTELEQSATVALREGTAWGLVAMAFLAVLKEGFETSVFLLAAFQSSTSALAAGAGAVIGVAVSVGIGIGIYRGGVRLNIGRFFRITGFFLVVVAAGLVLTAFRTAHEAGWIIIGQQRVVDLSWLAPPGSVQAALVTGVLGIPADPRLIEVLGWFGYLLPVLAYLLWPMARRPRNVPRFHAVLAGSFTIIAVLLAIVIPLPTAAAATSAPLVDASGASVGSSRIVATNTGFALTATVNGASSTTSLADNDATDEDYNGIAAQHWSTTTSASVAGKPTTISLDELVTLSGGRLPIGITASENPGPFAASWKSTDTSSTWISDGSLLDAASRTTTTLTLTGGGLVSPHVTSVDSATPSWSVASGHAAATAATIVATAGTARELLLYKLWIPIALLLAALVLVAHAAWRTTTRRRRDGAVTLDSTTSLLAPARSSS